MTGRARAPQHTAEDFAKFEEHDLLTKRALATLCIRTARQAGQDGDERAPEAIRYYRAERQAINEALQRQWYGDERPPAQAVEVKPAMAAGRSRNRRRAERATFRVEELFEED